MSPSNLVATSYSFGFDILSRKQRLQLDVMAAGTEGVQSMIDALIASGYSDRESIVDEVCDVTGDHVSHLVHDVLANGCGLHWQYDEDDDSYAPIDLH